MRLSSILSARTKRTGVYLAIAALLVTSGAVAANTGRAAPTQADPRLQAVTAAGQVLEKDPSAVQGAPGDAYATFSSTVDARGAAHVRYTRTHQGLRVHGGDFVVHLNPDGSYKSVSVGLTAPLTIATDPKVSASDAAEQARAVFTGTVESVNPPELIVDASSGHGRLAWETVIVGLAEDGQLPSHLHVISDAITGDQLRAFDDVQTVDGTGHSVYSGTVKIKTRQEPAGVFHLQEPLRHTENVCDLKQDQYCSGSSAFLTDTDNVWGDGTNANRQSAGVDVFYAMSTMDSYLYQEFGRTGVYNSFGNPSPQIHYGHNFANAFRLYHYLNFGDARYNGMDNARPLVTLDIVAHENAHALIDELVPAGGLIYEGESGGLNEATADIFGTMVEFHAGNASDPGDYVIGEKYLFLPLRYMHDPTLDGKSDGCWSTATKDLDVHQSSGVANHFFFNLAERTGFTPYGTSPICGSALPVAGIGRLKAARIWYYALANYFTSTTSYVDAANPANTARAGTLGAAADLFGACSQEYKAVQLAWSSVNVAGTDATCPGPSPVGPGTLTDEVNFSINSRYNQPGGGYAPYQWSATGLPPGLGIDPTVGVITGTPTIPGNYGVSITVTDAYGRSGTAYFTYQIATRVPNLRDKTRAQATSILQNAGLAVGTVGTTPVSESIDNGKVTSQSPPAGTLVLAGTAINFYVGVWNGNRL